jgi:hypothetical protein
MRRKAPVTWATVLERYHAHEGRCQSKRFEIAKAKAGGDEETNIKKLELQLAELWRAYLASSILLWHSGRTESLRQCVVNWDIWRTADESGADVIMIDPVQDKTGFRRRSEDQKKDVPKVLHRKLQSIYEAYMREHLPVLRRNLGPAARYEPTFTDAKNGEGASLCFPLFPGYWPASRGSSFTANNFIPVLGCKERKIRSLMIQQFTPDLLQQWGVDPVAIPQQFHQSKLVQDGSYKNGLRNAVNPLQAHILGWQ